MAYNKFQTREEETVFLDLINDNITETNVLSGVTFHKADGTAGVGILSKDGNFFKATDDDVMNALLAADNVGKVAQFNGTSDTYVDGGYYLIESESKKITFNLYLDHNFENAIQFFFNDEQESFIANTEYDGNYSLGTLIKNVDSSSFTFKFWSGPNVISDARYSVDGSIPFDSSSGIDITDNSSHYTQEVSLQPTDDMTINIVLDGYID